MPWSPTSLVNTSQPWRTNSILARYSAYLPSWRRLRRLQLCRSASVIIRVYSDSDEGAYPSQVLKVLVQGEERCGLLLHLRCGMIPERDTDVVALCGQVLDHRDEDL